MYTSSNAPSGVVMRFWMVTMFSCCEKCCRRRISRSIRLASKMSTKMLDTFFTATRRRVLVSVAEHTTPYAPTPICSKPW